MPKLLYQQSYREKAKHPNGQLVWKEKGNVNVYFFWRRMKAKKFCRYRYIIYFASLKPDTQKVFLSETSRISPVFHGQFKRQCFLLPVIKMIDIMISYLQEYTLHWRHVSNFMRKNLNLRKHYKPCHLLFRTTTFTVKSSNTSWLFLVIDESFSYKHIVILRKSRASFRIL